MMYIYICVCVLRELRDAIVVIMLEAAVLSS